MEVFNQKEVVLCCFVIPSIFKSICIHSICLYEYEFIDESCAGDDDE